MIKTRVLRNMLNAERLIQVVGAHDALSARLIEEAGFDAVWASGFGISAVHALPDANILTMTQYLQAAYIMNCATTIPIIADCNDGYGSINNVIHLTKEYERHGIAGICMEDKTFAKTNSFSKGDQNLVDVREFSEKIRAAKTSQIDPDFVVIARVEALIANKGLDETLTRALAYEESGADAILIHSKANGLHEIKQFMSQWCSKTPIIVVPTTYPRVTAQELETLGIQVVIYANQVLRRSIRSMREILATLRDTGNLISIENTIATLDEVFELQRLNEWINL